MAYILFLLDGQPSAFRLLKYSIDRSRTTVDSLPVPQWIVELLLPNHICTPFFTYPNLMFSIGVHVQPASGSKGLFLRLLIIRIRHSEFTT